MSAELPAHALERGQVAELGGPLRVRPDDRDAALGESRHRGLAGAREAEDRRGADLGQVGAEFERHRSFKRPERDEREEDRDDPETDDDLRLRPSEELEVVVERRHPEDPLARELERAHLEDHGDRLDDEEPADEDEEDLLLDEDGDGPERRAEREGARVAHEDLGGVRVEPQEAERGSDDRGAEDRELARAGHVGDEEVRRGLARCPRCTRGSRTCPTR